MNNTILGGLMVLVMGGCAAREAKVARAPAATPAPGSYEYALALADKCPTETSWAERAPAGHWRAVCGDADGNEVKILTPAAQADADRGFVDCDGHCDPGPSSDRCQNVADRAWNKADREGRQADAAYEDAYASCTEGQ